MAKPSPISRPPASSRSPARSTAPTRTIDADEVAILTQNGFYAAGQITYVQPSSGVASDFDLYVRGTLPASGDGVADGQIAQVDLSGSEKFFIYWMHNQFTQFLFNPSSLLPGQHVSVGGPLSGAANSDALSVKRVVLRNWGFNGTLVANSLNTGNSTFQMNINGFAGLLVPGQPVTVYVADGTKFRSGFSSLTDGQRQHPRRRPPDQGPHFGELGDPGSLHRRYELTSPTLTHEKGGALELEPPPFFFWTLVYFPVYADFIYFRA